MEDEFTVDVDLRYRDLDPLNHVNNAVFATYLEEARIAYLDEVCGVDLRETDLVLASLELSFERPIEMGDDPTIAVQTTGIGRTSVTIAYDVRTDGETAATGETTLVFVDRTAKRPTEMPAEVRDRIVSYEGLAGDGDA